jgi:hypothetical protein
LRAAEGPAGLEAAAFAPALAVYTAVLLADTATPTWNAARDELPFVFVSSASLAAGGLAMVTTPMAETGPARTLAVLGVVGNLAATTIMHRRMDPVEAEPLRQGTPGRMLRWSRALTIAGGAGALLGGRRRSLAVVSGLSLLTASALTRFGCSTRAWSPLAIRATQSSRRSAASPPAARPASPAIRSPPPEQGVR